MNKTIEEIKEMVKEGYLQRAVKEIQCFLEADEYRENYTVKDVYYGNFSDGGTVKDMIECDNLKFIGSNDIGSVNSIDNYTYYSWFEADKEILVNYINETSILKALRDLEKLI